MAHRFLAVAAGQKRSKLMRWSAVLRQGRMCRRLRVRSGSVLRNLADGEDRIVQAPAPDHIITSGIPTEALLAQVAVSKYADGLPLYRQEGIYARDGVELDRSLMAQWMGRVGFELEPLAHYVLHTIKQGERIFADETRLPTLAPGSGKVKTAWLWAYARDDRTFGGLGPPMVAYRFEDSRSGDCVASHLEGYRGILQVDVCGRPLNASKILLQYGHVVGF
jgi:transposase